MVNRLSTKKSERLANASHALHLMQTGPYAYISSHVQMYESIREHLNDSQICGIRELRIMVQRLHFGIFTAKNSPLREFFSRM